MKLLIPQHYNNLEEEDGCQQRNEDSPSRIPHLVEPFLSSVRLLNPSTEDDHVLDEDHEEGLDDIVGGVRNVERCPHVESRAEESEERADGDLKKGDEDEELGKDVNLNKCLDCGRTKFCL